MGLGLSPLTKCRITHRNKLTRLRQIALCTCLSGSHGDHTWSCLSQSDQTIILFLKIMECPRGCWSRFLHRTLTWLLRRRVNFYYLNTRSLKIKHRGLSEKHHEPRSDLTFPPALIVLLGGLLANFAYFACFLPHFGSRLLLSYFVGPIFAISIQVGDYSSIS